MKTGALVLVFSLLAAPWAEAADMPAPKPRKAGQAAAAQFAYKPHFQGCENIDDADTFAARACYTTFDPEAPRPGESSTTKRPTCDGRPPDITQLKAAYALAPSFVKRKLCGLTRHDGRGNTRQVGCTDCFQLFVVRVNPEKPWRSWGYWEAADRGTGDGVFLAISDDYLVGRKIADEENHVLGALLAHEPWPGTPSLPRFESTDDRLQLGVLAVLSHELGHTVFADTNADLNKQGERDEFNKVGESPGRRNQRYKCFHRDFIKTSWDHTNWRKRRWVGFGEQNRNKQRDISFDLAATRKDAANGNFAAVADVLRKVYEVRQFASLFAAVSPEEDFADSYKYRMLSSISAPPGLTMTFPDPKDSIPDVMGYLNERRTVPDKLGCAYDLSEQAN